MDAPDGRQVDPSTEILSAGTVLHRVHSHSFGAVDFNPGPEKAAPSSRFAFFGSSTIPVLYASATEVGAVSETLLHDVPIDGGRIDSVLLASTLLSQIATTRDLDLLALHGHGFRHIGATAEEITRTPPSRYAQTVPWAQSAYDAGLDGMCWMSRHHDTSAVYVLFARSDRDDPVQEHTGTRPPRAFAFLSDLDWLTRLLAPLNVRIAG